MEELFENLRENVSEECFNDILNIIERTLDESEFDPFEFMSKSHPEEKYSEEKKKYNNQINQDREYKGSKQELIQKSKAKIRNIKKRAKKEGIRPEFMKGFHDAKDNIPIKDGDPKDVSVSRRHPTDSSGEFPEYVLYREDD